MRIESFEWDRADDAGGNTAHISRHGISPEDVEEALTSNPLVLRGPDGRYLGYGKSADGRLDIRSVRPEGAGHRAAHYSSTDDRRRKAVVSEETRQAMTRKRSGKAIPKFSSDRAAAEFWSANDSAAYAAHLEEARVTVNPRLRRRIAERAAQKKAITLRLETQQIERAKLVAQRKSIPYQTLMRMWIAEGLAKEGVKTA